MEKVCLNKMEKCLRGLSIKVVTLEKGYINIIMETSMRANSRTKKKKAMECTHIMTGLFTLATGRTTKGMERASTASKTVGSMKAIGWMANVKVKANNA